MSRKINLGKILGPPSFNNSGGYGKEIVLKAMREACRQTLELAAENAWWDVNSGADMHNVEVSVNKESILSLINQIE